MKLLLVLHNIRSAYNVGSIFRTANGAGVEKIFLCGYTPRPENFQNYESGIMNQGKEKISKTALGAEKMVPWEYHSQTWRLLKKLGKEGIKIVALEQDPKAIDYRKFSVKGGQKSLALILGNEVGGLSREILKYADEIMEIPMRGKKESLNVSVAAGIALYKIMEVN